MITMQGGVFGAVSDSETLIAGLREFVSTPASAALM